jgi:2'-5' RNA ligase
MKNIINSIPGYKVNEYSLVLNPHEELRNKIVHLKEQFAKTFENKNAVYSKPFVSLVNFTQYEMIEDRIMNKLQSISMGYYPFKVDLKDYGSFPSHTIYIQVTSKIPIQTLIKSIRSDTQGQMKLDDENKPHFMMEPRITIGRKLLPWQYEQGWLEYSHKYFTGRFIADSMLLLKRPIGELKYQILRRFEFQNLPVTTKQGELFGT